VAPFPLWTSILKTLVNMQELHERLYPLSSMDNIKDAAAANWCENASALTKLPWRYVKVPQKGFEVLQPSRFADLAALAPTQGHF
jgi:hypothetical protein